MRALSTLVAVTLVTVPLLLLPGWMFHYDVTPKVVALLVVTAAAAALYRPLRPLDWLLGLQAVSLVVATAFSVDPALSVSGSNWRRMGLVVQIALVLFAHVAARVPASALLRAIAASGGAAALYGIGQYFGWDLVVPRESYHVGEGVWTIVRPPGTLGHAGYFAVYLLHVASVGLAVASGDADRRWRRLGAASAVLALIAVALNGTRAALLALGVGLVVLVLARRPRLNVRRLAVGVAVVAAVAVFYFSPVGLPLRARTRWYREDPGGGGRLALWADTLRMSARRWVVGFGPETYSSQFPRFESEELARRFPERYFESPHNIFLDALVSQGLAGLGVLAALAGLGLWRLRGSPFLLAGLTASLVANQFVAFTVPTALLFYTTVGLGAAEPGPRRRWILAPVAAGLAAVAVSLAWTDFWLERTRASLAAGRIDQGTGQYQRLRRLALPGVDTDLWYSRALYATFAGHPEALQAAERAAARSEQRSNAWYSLAGFYAVRNDFRRTEESLRAAIDWAPRWYKPRWMLAQVLEQAGRMAEAEVQARRAVELYPNGPPEIRNTWERIRARRSVQ
jgi:tetratricopeptide (TPR) repeat protein